MTARRAWLAFAALAGVLALPFLARSGRRPAAPSGQAETLIVLTPHNEAVRYELGRGFAEHMSRRGRRVEVDWRALGGSAEIARYLASQYAASFERHWTERLGRRWSPAVAAGFATPQPDNATGEAADARHAFLESDVGCGADILFGGGRPEGVRHAAAGRLVDAGIVARHPELFGAGGIPQRFGGEPFWDRDGRWIGTCLSSFGICFNREVLARLGVSEPPSSWRALADPVYHGQLALADPTKSGSVGTAFEMIVQSEMSRALADAPDTDAAARDAFARREGWARAMRLIRRIGANARYFTDASAKIPLDVSTGDAAAGMCIDYYGRFQAEVAAVGGGPARVGFATARGETAMNADPIGVLRGAPHRELAVAFIDFVLSEDGQKLWDFRRGTPGGPKRYTLRRLPILPRLYDREFDAYRADSDNPYEQGKDFEYREAWTGPLFGAIAFVVRAMCVETEAELAEAYRALSWARFSPRATALFDDLTLVDYATVSGPLRAALASHDPLEEARWSIRLARHFRSLYRQVAALARERR
jgi:ABC-type Fe3+ transport system substrate-binding protein